MSTVIVGGGIVGTAIAARLAATDRDVTLLERDAIGGETTAASAGIVMRTAVDPDAFGCRFRTRARSVYRRLFERESIETTRVGTLYVAETASFADRLEASAATLREHGVEASFVPPEVLPDLGLDSDGSVGALHTPEDELCEPTAIAEWFADCAARGGVDVRTGEAVVDVRTDDGSVTGIVTDGGTVEADVVVNATGPWAPRLNDLAGVSLPLRHTLGPMAELEAPAPIEIPVTILESERYVRPAGDRRAWIGEYRTAYEAGGLYDPAEISIPEGFRESAIEMDAVVPALADASIVDEWVGLRTVTPDGQPIVGETSVEGFVVACGMTGQGITIAPAVADVVRKTIDGSVDSEVRDRLSPDRFRSTE
ncbi:NAD(P)/FAD-dependent oxidoreductase [Halosolutus gelatinilyticus]|uniref:NAD(P)/FAD-dependent oxidoreductase n=1 Tax=Halosolutus gelatinilyticus TaxID=2931975 RepID=UPI001FF108D2|nr:FAD-dependent oxidoreductase [Halosolutus gelatinilyticus]